jgi:D-glycero-alpha-D-manno-heptose-7-phosphate kinase
MIITQTPLRISLLGGNTDFPAYFKKYGGEVLTTTIDKYVYCIVKDRFDSQIWINYSRKEIVDDVNKIKHDLVRESMKLVGVTKGIEITFLSDIPSEGSGLGSSSAVTIGLLNALHNYKGESVTARQLAEEACHIEIDILKKPIGMQDQYAIAFGGLNHIEFGNKILVTSETIKNPEELMLFYTGKTRKADIILSKMKLNKKILNKNKEIVDNYLNDYINLGEALFEYWLLKKLLNKHVTTTSIDKMYKKALYLGADGGKIVGAGGGGFLLLVVPLEKQEYLRNNLGLRELNFKLSRYGSRIIFNIKE